MSAPVTEKHRKLANEVFWREETLDNDAGTIENFAQAIADAEAAGYVRGVRDAAECVALRASRWEPGDQDGLEHEELMRASRAILALLPKETKR